jgi:hypothetical protein
MIGINIFIFFMFSLALISSFANLFEECLRIAIYYFFTVTFIALNLFCEGRKISSHLKVFLLFLYTAGYFPPHSPFFSFLFRNDPGTSILECL